MIRIRGLALLLLFLIPCACHGSAQEPPVVVTLEIRVTEPDGTYVQDAYVKWADEMHLTDGDQALHIEYEVQPGELSLEVGCPQTHAGDATIRKFSQSVLGGARQLILQQTCVPRRVEIPLVVMTGQCEAEVRVDDRLIDQTHGGVLHAILTRDTLATEPWLVVASPLTQDCRWAEGSTLVNERDASTWVVEPNTERGVWVHFYGSVRKNRTLGTRSATRRSRPYRL